MNTLTCRQQQILGFIQVSQQRGENPSLRDIARHFKFRSMTAALDHVRALKRKGWLENRPKQARSLRVVSLFKKLRELVVDIPVYGSIPAGFPEDKRQEPEGCLSVDMETLGIRSTTCTFALEVKGDSMIGKHILDGDHAIFEHGVTPKSGDVVAALIDNESTLKTFVLEKGKPWLRAENPKYPKMIPASELVIQGVMRALIRKQK